MAVQLRLSQTVLPSLVSRAKAGWEIGMPPDSQTDLLANPPFGMGLPAFVSTRAACAQTQKWGEAPCAKAPICLILGRGLAFVTQAPGRFALGPFGHAEFQPLTSCSSNGCFSKVLGESLFKKKCVVPHNPENSRCPLKPLPPPSPPPSHLGPRLGPALSTEAIGSAGWARRAALESAVSLLAALAPEARRAAEPRRWGGWGRVGAGGRLRGRQDVLVP